MISLKKTKKEVVMNKEDRDVNERRCAKCIHFVFSKKTKINNLIFGFCSFFDMSVLPRRPICWEYRERKFEYSCPT